MRVENALASSATNAFLWTIPTSVFHLILRTVCKQRLLFCSQRKQYGHILTRKIFSLPNSYERFIYSVPLPTKLQILSSFSLTPQTFSCSPYKKFINISLLSLYDSTIVHLKGIKNSSTQAILPTPQVLDFQRSLFKLIFASN